MQKLLTQPFSFEQVYIKFLKQFTIAENFELIKLTK